MAEVDRVPVGLLEDIIEARAYGRAYATLAANPSARGGLVDDAIENEMQLRKDELGLGE